jgi:hypothetical protein
MQWIDKMLACHDVSCKCYRWWKTLFFHLVDMAVVNGFLLFQQHRASDPDNPDLYRRSTYNIVDFREELVRQITGLEEYDVPPVNETVLAKISFVLSIFLRRLRRGSIV